MTVDPVAEVDSLVHAFNAGLSSPGVETRDVVLVTGPWLAGVSSLIGALRDHVPEQTFVESEDIGPSQAPAAVLFVVSAVAPLTESDCALVDLAIARTDLLIGVVSKIDVHHNWREVLAADRALLAARSPRHREVDWVGVAAAPDLSEPQLDDLVEMLREHRADPDLARRNRLRAWEARLDATIGRHQDDGDGRSRQEVVAGLRDQRDDTIRARRVAKSARTVALRGQIRQARVALAHFARNRCASVRAELAEDASGMTRRRLPEFEPYVRRRVDEVVGEVDQGVTKHLADVALELGLTAPTPSPRVPRPEVPAPPLKSRRLEARLMLLLGAGFGLGVALTLSRLFADFAPGLTVAGAVAGGAVGLAVTLWVVAIRGLLHDRAVLDRWIGDVTAALRSAVEELAATRVLTAESALSAELNARDEAERTTVAGRVGEIDAELREHAVATARAAALRNRRLPLLQRALDAVRAELAGH